MHHVRHVLPEPDRDNRALRRSPSQHSSGQDADDRFEQGESFVNLMDSVRIPSLVFSQSILALGLIVDAG